MNDNDVIKPPSARKTIEELKSAAIAELERRGYNIRGKTPAEVRQLLKQRRTKQKSTT